MDIVERARADVLRSGTWADTGNLILEMAEEIEKLRVAIAAEREACAKIAASHTTPTYTSLDIAANARAHFIAAAIRNRSQP